MNQPMPGYPNGLPPAFGGQPDPNALNPGNDPSRAAAIEMMQDYMKMKADAGKYIPVIKRLQDIDVQVRVMDVMIGEEPTRCFVIVKQELQDKEYEELSGINPETFN